MAKTLSAVNPANGETLHSLPAWEDQYLYTSLSDLESVNRSWQETPLEKRAQLLLAVAQQLRKNRETYARLITLEMGKLLQESLAEIDKCAAGCEYFAQHGATLLADELVASDAGKSYITYQPLGTVLAIMPWNFPFWQVFRFAAPALLAGNTALLKHASNVPGCAQAIEEIFIQSGVAKGVFRNLPISAAQAQALIADPRIHAVTLTGSEQAGRQVAAAAGAQLKKCVLELGGSDAFIVLEDADLGQTVKVALASRFINCGQSCIAAKRFIVVDAIADDFVTKLRAAIETLAAGDPLDNTTTLAPLARDDLRTQLDDQVQRSIAAGAKLLCGGTELPRPGYYYAATLLDHVDESMPAAQEELFGPVAVVIRVADEKQAMAVANRSRYGLGGSIWSRDKLRAEHLALQLQSGCAFVNGLVKSDSRLPFGGIKNSGYGRELATPGIREFVNIKTVWIA